MSDDFRRPKRHPCPTCESSQDDGPHWDSNHDHLDKPYRDHHHESYHNHHHPRPPIDRCSPMPPWEPSEPHRRPPRPPRNW